MNTSIRVLWSHMQVKEKLNEAHYFLDMLRNAPQDNAHERQFIYILSAFLNSWASVLDVLLYDYLEKFSLGFSRSERITERDFEIAARALNHTQATLFIRWWNQQLGLLSNNPLWTKQNLMVHRGYPPTMHVYMIYVAESMAISSTISVYGASTITAGSSGPSAIPPTTTPSSATPQPAPQTAQTRAEIRFADRQDRSVIDYCQMAYDEMERIVSSALALFGT
jgi:hypothetical protein